MARRYISASEPQLMVARAFQWKPTFSRAARGLSGTKQASAFRRRRVSSWSSNSWPHSRQTRRTESRTLPKSYSPESSRQSLAHRTCCHVKGCRVLQCGQRYCHSLMSVVACLRWVSSFSNPPCEQKIHLPSQPKAVTRASASAMWPCGHLHVSSPISHRMERLCRLLRLWAPATQRVMPLLK